MSEIKFCGLPPDWVDTLVGTELSVVIYDEWTGEMPEMWERAVRLSPLEFRQQFEQQWPPCKEPK